MGEGCSAYIKVFKEEKSSNSPSAQNATDGFWENDALNLDCPRGNARVAIWLLRRQVTFSFWLHLVNKIKLGF